MGGLPAFREMYEEEKKNKQSLVHLKSERYEDLKMRIDNLVSFE